MNCFPDTSFLCSVYRPQVHSSTADAFMDRRDGPLPVSTLLLLEFRQSCRWQVRIRSIERTKGFSKSEAAQMLRDLESDLRTQVLAVEPADWARVHQIAEELSAKHTEGGGHRLVDILHVATALHLGKDEFLTFDENQKRLAESEGLRVVV